MIRSALSKPIIFTCGILGIAAAAAAMRTTSWSPIEAFLDHRTAPESQQAAVATELTQTSPRSAGQASFGAYSPSAQGPAVFPQGGVAPMHDSAKSASASGFAADRLHGAYSAGANGPSASAGNLWRLMGLARPAAAGGTHATHAAAARTSAPKAPWLKPGCTKHT